MSTILFVCTGNLCRSPMAEGLLRQRLVEGGLDGRFRVMSAGIYAADGEGASRNAVQVMADRSIDITDHIAHTITADDIIKADLILVMGREHEQVIRQTWPQYAWKVHRLSEMSGRRQDIADPYGGSLQKYEACAATISRYVDEGLDRIFVLV
jgi:protein-tyrosine phosphatase